MINKPYVKKYNRNGEVTNPIKEVFRPAFPNRSARRANLQKPKYFGLRQQIIHMLGGERRLIIHLGKNK